MATHLYNRLQKQKQGTDGHSIFTADRISKEEIQYNIYVFILIFSF